MLLELDGHGSGRSICPRDGGAVWKVHVEPIPAVPLPRIHRETAHAAPHALSPRIHASTYRLRRQEREVVASCYRFLYLIKALAAHGAARAARRPGLRSCLRPAPARPPTARLTAWVDEQPKQAFRHGNRHMACVATSAADCGQDGRPKDGQRRGRGGLLRRAGRLPGLRRAGHRTPAVTDDGSVRRPHHREGVGGEQLLPRSGAGRCGRSASVPVSLWLMSVSSEHQNLCQLHGWSTADGMGARGERWVGVEGQVTRQPSSGVRCLPRTTGVRATADSWAPSERREPGPTAGLGRSVGSWRSGSGRPRRSIRRQ